MATVDIHPKCLAEDIVPIRDRKVREGIMDKIGVLEREPGLGRPLRGDLRGHFRTTYGRYRIVYRWDQVKDRVLVWFVGQREEDLYALVEKLLRRRQIGERKE
jgi:mRNA-degrading endonuclease RelE of RelBE toxin-antitoxin system